MTLPEEKVFEKTGESIAIEVFYCDNCGTLPISETTLGGCPKTPTLEYRYCSHCEKAVSPVRATIDESQK